MQPNIKNHYLVTDACKAFAKDHFAHFGCLPAEFEYENAVFGFDTYMGLLSDDDLHEITGQVPKASSPYPLPEKMGYCGESFRMWKFADVHFVPTYHQWRLNQSVYKAVIEQELFYTAEVYQFVVQELSDILTPELLTRNSLTMPVENGSFGMEVYYMRQVVEAHQAIRNNTEALSRLISEKGIGVSSVFKGPYKFGGHIFSSFKLTGINYPEGILCFEAKKRGSRNRYTFSIGAGCERFISHTEVGYPMV